jgi:hypothetical protein
MTEENIVVNDVVTQEAPEIATDESLAEENKVVDHSDQEEESDLENDNKPFPKKAVRAISRRESKIEKLRAELREVKAQLQQTSPKVEDKPLVAEKQSSNQGQPAMDDFETFDDYINAMTDWKIQSALEKKTTLDKEKESSLKERSFYEERNRAFDAKAVEYESKLSDFATIADEVGDTISALPSDVQRAILEADDGAIALYALAKEDRLDELERMNGRQAAAFLAKAEIRGQELLKKVSRVSAAPAPIKGVKGTGTFQKDIMDMTPEEIVQKYRSF